MLDLDEDNETLLSPAETLNKLRSDFYNLVLCYACITLLNYSTLVITTCVFSTISLFSFIICLAFSMGLCFLSGSVFSLQEKRTNLSITILMYTLNLLGFINQEICNIWETSCPYLSQEMIKTLIHHSDNDDSEPNNGTELADVDSPSGVVAQSAHNQTSFSAQGSTGNDELKAGLLLLTVHGLSVVLNAWLVMICTQMINTAPVVATIQPDMEDNNTRTTHSPYKAQPKDYKFCNNFYELEDCLVCHNPLNSEEQVHLLECKHIFHKDCFNEWYQTGKCCPICRREINNSSFPSRWSKLGWRCKHALHLN